MKASLLRLLSLAAVFNFHAPALADELSNCLVALETTQYSMDFSQPLKTRKLVANEKQLLRDFAEKHSRYKNDPKALETLFTEVDAITQQDSVEQVVNIMSYHLESKKDLAIIKKELSDMSLQLAAMWDKNKPGLHIRDTQNTPDWNSVIVHQRAKSQNEKIWVKLSELLKEKGDTADQVAIKLETLLNSNNLDGTLLLRYEDLEKALQVQGRTMGFAAQESAMKPTSDEVFLCYLFYLGVLKPQGKDLSDLRAAIVTAKADHGGEISNVGNLIFWSIKNLSSQSPDSFSLGGRIISVQDFLRQQQQ